MVAVARQTSVGSARADSPERVPPWDDAAEAAVLSATILDPTALPKCIDFLRPEHFYSGAHQRIFEACCDLYAKREAIDSVTVGSWLKDRQRLPEIGGAPYLASILDAAPVVHNVRQYALKVHDNWRRREVAFACEKISARAFGSVPEVQRFCDEAARAIATIGAQNPGMPIETMSEALTRVLAEAMGAPEPDALKPVQAAGVPTGIDGLDRLIGGLRRKAKTTIAGEKGSGKTALALQAAIRAATAGIAVFFASTELTLEELMRRAVCAEANVSREKIKNKRVTPADIRALQEAKTRLEGLPLHIDPTARVTAEQIRARAEAHGEKTMLLYRRPLGLVIVDYVQRLHPPPRLAGREEREQFAHSTRELKIMAQELDVAVVELSQANPPIQKGKKIIRTHFGTSVIGKEADEEIFIVPDPASDPSSDVREMELDVVKQRDGRVGKVRVIYRGPVFRFDDPNEASPTPSRQYIDREPEREPAQGFWDQFDDGGDA